MDKELKKKIRFLENRGWYKDISGNYSNQACLELSRTVEEIQKMDWKDLRELENLWRHYV